MMVCFRRRRPGYIDRVGGRKGLLEPLLQRLVQLAFFSIRSAFGPVEMLMVISGNERLCDLAERPTMLDDGDCDNYKTA